MCTNSHITGNAGGSFAGTNPLNGFDPLLFEPLAAHFATIYVHELEISYESTRHNIKCYSSYNNQSTNYGLARNPSKPSAHSVNPAVANAVGDKASRTQGAPRKFGSAA
jgi:hypothetical protein